MVPNFATVLAALIVLAVLYAASLHNYLLFHSLAEVFSIVIAFGIFMVAWNTRRYTANHYLLLIGIAYLFIGALDFVHTLAYEGMNVFVGYDANAATQLWIAARYMEALTFLVAPFMLDRKIRPVFYFLVYGTLSAAILLTIFYWPIFPACYLPAAGGLTPFKIIRSSQAFWFCIVAYVSTPILRPCCSCPSPRRCSPSWPLRRMAACSPSRIS